MGRTTCRVVVIIAVNWYTRGNNNGFRLDHALTSRSLDARITNVRYSHAEREAGVTDHSVMVVEVGQ